MYAALVYWLLFCYTVLPFFIVDNMASVSMQAYMRFNIKLSPLLTNTHTRTNTKPFTIQIGTSPFIGLRGDGQQTLSSCIHPPHTHRLLTVFYLIHFFSSLSVSLLPSMYLYTSSLFFSLSLSQSLNSVLITSTSRITSGYSINLTLINTV